MGNKSYFNTTGEAIKLRLYEKQAETQEERIWVLFLRYNELSASQVWRKYNAMSATPITSIRRALTVMAGKGLLVRTGKKREGLYGRDEYIYAKKGSYGQGKIKF